MNEKKKKKKFNFKDSKFSKKMKSFFNSIGKKLKINERKFTLLEIMLLIAVAFAFGILISEAFVFKSDTEYLDTTPGTIANNNKIEKVYNTIINNYYKDIDAEKLKEAAIEGMMSYLDDDYSIYFNETEANEFNELLDGTYYGIGMEVTQSNDVVYVTAIFDNTPASKADLRVGDILISVNDIPTSGKTLDSIVELIKGSSDKTVKFVITRENETLEKNIVTEKVDIPSVYYEVMETEDKKIGYIYISIFAQNTDEQFNAALQALENENIDALIIDVRNNIGGHLDTVQNILNNFFTKDEIIYQIQSKEKITKVYGNAKTVKNYNVAILINNVSASGSEILAAAFKEVKNSDIIGTTTFGKGTVQRAITLSTGDMFKITVETWLTPLGNQINEVGVEPTIEVTLSTDEDNQLNKALEILKDK